jgi:hypothetical protein
MVVDWICRSARPKARTRQRATTACGRLDPVSTAPGAAGEPSRDHGRIADEEEICRRSC